jgi:hypothetical protein
VLFPVLLYSQFLRSGVLQHENYVVLVFAVVLQLYSIATSSYETCQLETKILFSTAFVTVVIISRAHSVIITILNEIAL